MANLLLALNNVTDYVGLNVIKVAHNMHHPVARYVKQELKLPNSFEIWHMMKKKKKRT